MGYSGVSFIDKAKKDINTARYLYEARDEMYVDNACFCVQQAIEKELKYVLDNLGMDYKSTHDIENLLKLIHLKLPLYINLLNDKAEELTSWATEPRYNIDFMATRDSLKEGFIIFDLILNDIEYNLKCINSNEFKVCYNFIKNKGYKFETEIIQQMCNIIEKINIERPLQQNIYIDIKQNLHLVKERQDLKTSFFS